MTLDPEQIDPRNYRSYKPPVLLRIFFRKFNPDDPKDIIPAPIIEVIQTIEEFGLRRPGNIHNCFKDIVRNGKMPATLKPITDLNYEIRQVDGGGEFINSDREDLRDVIDLPSMPAKILNSSTIPPNVFDLIRTDEGGILSAIDYSNLLDDGFGADVLKIQAPVKVQPNEIDGTYFCILNDRRVLLSVEVKSKGPDVLLKYQLFGGAKQAQKHFGMSVDVVLPVGIKLEKDNSVFVVVFPEITEADPWPVVDYILRYELEPVPTSWDNQPKSKEQPPLL